MGFGYFPYAQGGVDPTIYDTTGQQLAAFGFSGTVATVYGSDATGESRRVYANSTDAYPYAQMEGLESILFYVPTGKHFAVHDQTRGQSLRTWRDATYPNWAGGDLTGEHLKMLANSVDALPNIYISASGWITLSCEDVANGIIDYYKDTQHVGRFSEGTSTFRIESKGTNFDIELIPDGTGNVRFGTFAGTGDVACNGNIVIKDAAGNSRKLMTTA